MSPGEYIYFFVIAFIIFLVISFIWFLFRKRRKLVIILSSVLVIGYIGYYLYFPTIKKNTHAERYEQISDYLDEAYPDQNFNISPEHYEAGFNVGEFNVYDIKSPTMGVRYRVNDTGEVRQVSTWSTNNYPMQEELWEEIAFFYGETYTLGKEIAEINKIDEWIEGELTAFALIIDNNPAIAIFNYADDVSYSLLDLQVGDSKGYVSIERDGNLFVYIDENYQGEKVTILLKNGEEYALNTSENKGRLIVEKLNNK